MPYIWTKRCRLLWSKEGRDKIRAEWLRNCIVRYEAFNRKEKHLWKSPFHKEEETEREERNDVFIYKMLKYPPKATPPTPN